MSRLLSTGLAIVAFLVANIVYAASPHKSPNDSRSYQSYTLPNKLKVLLVSDPEGSKAAAALDVGVGSGADPAARQGLAHFLEHMLFLGTEKYPESGEYQDFISSHGGGHNAYTSFDNTNYFFDVDAAYLEPSLDRFAQFFVAPLFNQEYVEREINAVESEYRAKLKEDSRRSLDVFKELINPDHPFSKLAVGNVETLSGRADDNTKQIEAKVVDLEAAKLGSLRQELLQFHEQHYSARNMSLVVIGAEPLKELRKMVDVRFGAISKGAKPAKAEQISLFSEGFLPSEVHLSPEKESRSLGVTFPIPAVRSVYRYKPTQYIGNIIGHEGKGSLLSLLKQRGWAESLSAGAGLEYEGGSTFNVSIALTEAGLANKDAILAALFQLIEQIRSQGMQAWRYEEQQDSADVSFRFQEQGRAIGYASHLASNLQRYPARDVIRSDYLMARYKPRLIRQFLGYLRPDNALVTVMAKGLEYDTRSRWYDVEYKVLDIAPSRSNAWLEQKAFAALGLPQANPFIPKDFTLVAEKTSVANAGKPVADADNKVLPQKIESTATAEVWWAADKEFKVPRAQLHFNIKNSAASATARNAAMTQLLATAVSDSLNEISYPALLAGVSFNIRSHAGGLSIRVGGYDDKQELLVEKIATQLKNVAAQDEQRLQDLHTELMRSWSNSKKRLPYQQLFSTLNQEILSGAWSAEQLAAALPSVTLAEFTQYAQQFLSSSSVQAMMVGNLSSERAKKHAAILTQTLSCNQQDHCPAAPRSVSKLAAEQFSGRDIAVEHNDSAFLLYFQGADQTDRVRAQMAMTAQILQADYFQQLRTEQQLGYIVFASPAPVLDVPGLAFIVQSPTHSVSHIEQATLAFLQSKREQLDTDSMREQFEQQRAAVLTELQETPKNLAEQSERYWAQLAMGYPSFDRREALITAIQEIKFEQWHEFFERELNGGLLIWSSGGRELGKLKLSPNLISEGQLKSAKEAFIVGATQESVR